MKQAWLNLNYKTDFYQLWRILLEKNSTILTSAIIETIKFNFANTNGQKVHNLIFFNKILLS